MATSRSFLCMLLLSVAALALVSVSDINAAPAPKVKNCVNCDCRNLNSFYSKFTDKQSYGQYGEIGADGKTWVPLINSHYATIKVEEGMCDGGVPEGDGNIKVRWYATGEIRCANPGTPPPVGVYEAKWLDNWQNTEDPAQKGTCKNKDG